MSKFTEYSNPNVLVSTQWVAENLENPDVRILECNEDLMLYDDGHIVGASHIEWFTDLNDPIERDYIDGEKFQALMQRLGINRDTTLVFYGDQFNWWACYAFWVFSLFGHKNLKIMDGGRNKWEAENRPLVEDVPEFEPSNYPLIERNDSDIRAFYEEVHRMVKSQQAIIDVRTPQEYIGNLMYLPEFPDETSARRGHIKGAVSIPWETAVSEDGTFKSLSELEQIYIKNNNFERVDPVVAYCRIGERSAHSWFVLHHLLGFEKAKNYDGSWTEWGNIVRAPIER